MQQVLIMYKLIYGENLGCFILNAGLANLYGVTTNECIDALLINHNDNAQPLIPLLLW